MPLNALSDATVHHTLPVSEIGPALNRLVEEEIPSRATGQEVSKKDMPRFSGFTCPECRGPLYESDRLHRESASLRSSDAGSVTCCR